MTKLEKEIEKKLVDAVKAAGGQCLKWTSPGTTGLPDRIVLLPRGKIAFVELKRPRGSRKGSLQPYWRRVLMGLGFLHWWVYTEADIEALLYRLGQGRAD